MRAAGDEFQGFWVKIASKPEKNWCNPLMKLHPNLFASERNYMQCRFLISYIAIGHWSHRHKRLHVLTGQKSPDVGNSWLAACNVVHRIAYLPLFKWRTGGEHTEGNIKQPTLNVWKYRYKPYMVVWCFVGFSYNVLDPLFGLSTNMTQHVYFNVLYDHVLPESTSSWWVCCWPPPFSRWQVKSTHGRSHIWLV